MALHDEEVPVSIDIEQIRKREQAATPGPWNPGPATDDPLDIGERIEWVADTLGGYDDEKRHLWAVWVQDGGSQVVIPALTGDGPNADENACFIAHAREDVPALLDEVERLRAAVDAVRAHLGGLLDEWERESPEEWAAVHPTVYGAIDAARYSVLSDFRAALSALTEHLGEG